MINEKAAKKLIKELEDYITSCKTNSSFQFTYQNEELIMTHTRTGEVRSLSPSYYSLEVIIEKFKKEIDKMIELDDQHYRF